VAQLIFYYLSLLNLFVKPKKTAPYLNTTIGVSSDHDLFLNRLLSWP